MTVENRLVFSLRGQKGYVDGAHFQDADLANVDSNTVCLTLENSLITDQGIFSLPPLDLLRCLDLDGTRITDRALSKLGDFPSLEELWIEQTAITDSGLRHLHNRTRLKFVSITDSYVTDHGITLLRTAIPNITIH